MEPDTTADTVTGWLAEVGSDARLSLRAKLRLWADRLREADEEEEPPRP